ncbi:hypothetical protein OB236_23790, partial [Paenibacillus sp. WQ 127069]
MHKKIIQSLCLFLYIIITNSYLATAMETYNYSVDGQLTANNSYKFIYDKNGNLIKKIKRSLLRSGFDSENFENYMMENSNYVIPVREGRDARIVPDGSLQGAYTMYAKAPVAWEWDTYLTSDPSKLKLEPNTTYTVSFKHKTISEPGSGGYFDFFVRSLKGTPVEDRGWLTWNEAAGTVGSKVVTFTTGTHDDYQLSWGMRYGGAVLIDDIRVIKNNESFEAATLDNIDYVIPVREGRDARIVPDGSLQGAYTMYAKAPVAWEWD